MNDLVCLECGKEMEYDWAPCSHCGWKAPETWEEPTEGTPPGRAILSKPNNWMKWTVWLLLALGLGFFFFCAPLHAENPSQADFNKATLAFQAYVAGKEADIQRESGGFREPGLPFLLTHGHPTKVCVILFHGLSDSPYFMRDLADDLYAQGYNVVAPLLTGNGTDLADLQKVQLEDWRKDEDFALQVASGLGEQVVAGGLSAGGALGLDLSRRHPGAIRGLLLFSPALSFWADFTFMACWLPDEYVAKKPREVPIRYSKISNNSVCQLYRLVQRLDLLRDHPEDDLPIFAVLTEYDDAIRVPWTIHWIESHPKADHRIVAYIKPKGKSKLRFLEPSRVSLVPTEEIRHANVTRRTNQYDTELNPHYDEMEKALRDFMTRNFPLDR